jgi:hypothetical protein
LIDFEQELDRGHRAERLVAIELLDYHFTVRLGDIEEGEIGDSIDIFADNCLLEIKSRSESFTNGDDWPFPSAFVGDPERWKRDGYRPCAVVYVSEQNVGGIFAINASDRARATWTEQEIYDSRCGFHRATVSAPRSCFVSWRQLIDHIRRGH